MRLGLGIAALEEIRLREPIKADGDAGVIGSQQFHGGRQAAHVERFGSIEIAVGKVGARKVIDHLAGQNVIVSVARDINGEGAVEEFCCLREPSLGPVELAEVVQTPGQDRIIGQLLRNCGSACLWRASASATRPLAASSEACWACRTASATSLLTGWLNIAWAPTGPTPSEKLAATNMQREQANSRFIAVRP